MRQWSRLLSSSRSAPSLKLLLVFRLFSQMSKKYAQNATDSTRAEKLRHRDWLSRDKTACHWLSGLANRRRSQRWLAGKCADPATPATAARVGGVAGGRVEQHAAVRMC